MINYFNLINSLHIGYACKCKAGFKLAADGRCAEDDTPFILLMRGTQIIDVSLTPGDNVAGTITPIVGIENGKQVEYDKKTSAIYWLESKGEDEDNVSCFFFLDYVLFI